MLQIIMTLSLYLVLVIPVGIYLYHIAAGKRTFADSVFNRIDSVIYTVCGINERIGMSWKQYALALIGINLIMLVLGFLILTCQNMLFLNPQDVDGMEISLAFNTAVSFMTNTNLQHYSGETGLSYLSQMLVITFMMFTSAASGYAACIAFIRGITDERSDNLGNFFNDLVRINSYCY